MLLVGAGLMINSYFRLRGVGPGFDADHVVEMAVQLDSSATSMRERVASSFTNLAERVVASTGCWMRRLPPTLLRTAR